MCLTDFSYHLRCVVNVDGNEKIFHIHPNDACAVTQRLSIFKSAVKANLSKVTVSFTPVNDSQYDIFKVFTMIDDFYDALVALTNRYSWLPQEFKDSFSESFLGELRQKVFNVSLLNKI